MGLDPVEIINKKVGLICTNPSRMRDSCSGSIADIRQSSGFQEQSAVVQTDQVLFGVASGNKRIHNVLIMAGGGGGGGDCCLLLLK